MKIRSRFKNFEIAIDEKIMRDRFQRELTEHGADYTPVSKLYVTRVFPSKKGGFIIQYELYSENSGLPGYGKKILWGRLLEAGQSLSDYIDDSEVGYFVLEDIGLIIPVFPFDPRLKSLPGLIQFAGGSRIAKTIGTILKGDIKITDCEILGYRLEKRCVLRYTLETRKGTFSLKKIVAKTLRRSDFDRLLRISKLLAKGGFAHDSPDGITIPVILGSDDTFKAVFMEDAPGKSLHFLFEKANFPTACSEAGRALKKLHKLDTGELKIYTAGDELGNLGRFRELIINMYPEFEDEFGSQLDELSRAEPGTSPRQAFCHRDFFDKQFLYSESRSVILDYDNAARTDPALDMGNFVAHLILRKIQHPDQSANIDRGIASFIESYGDRNSELQNRVNWWIRSSLLRLFGLYILRPRWRNLAPELLIYIANPSANRLYGGAYGA